MKLTYIYAHVVPIEDEIFYIGKADDPWDRLAKHQARAKTKKTYQANKLRSLAAHGVEPRVEIIAEVLVAEWEFWEKHYIKYFRDLGFQLTNATPGGEGGDTISSHPDKESIRSRIVKAQTGQTRSPECRAKISESNRRRVISEESKEKNRQAHLGRRLSPAACFKVSQSLVGNTRRRGKKSSEATRLKQSLIATGVKRGPYRKKSALT